jgi:hypothetical protein
MPVNDDGKPQGSDEASTLVPEPMTIAGSLPTNTSAAPVQPPAPKPDPESEKKGILSQPLSAWAYMGIAGVGLVIAVALLIVFVWKAPVLIAHGISNKFFYVLLIPLGLSTAAFVFGGMRTYASLSGRIGQYNTTWEIVGPGVGVVLVVIAGLWLVRESLPFSVTLRFRHSDGPLKSGGKATIYKGQAFDEQPITPAGDATFKEIANEFRAQSTRIDLEAPGYLLAEPNKEYELTPGVIPVNVVPDPNYVNSEIEKAINRVMGVPASPQGRKDVENALKELAGKKLSTAQRAELMEQFRINNQQIGNLIDNAPADLEARVRDLTKIACRMKVVLGDQDFWRTTKQRIQTEMVGFEMDCE